MDFIPRHNYEIGTKVQHRDGYVFVKTESGMVAEHRFVMSQKIGRPLAKGEVVLRIKPDRMNNRETNLVKVHHNLSKFKYLPHSRVIYIPGGTRVPA